MYVHVHVTEPDWDHSGVETGHSIDACP